MNIPFYKYHGTGNDFVLIDQRKTQFLNRENTAIIHQICQRHFGVGADGLILLENHPTLDFEMIYFNSDGNESSMCGNGGRCIVAFAHFLGVFKESCQFMAIDGIHDALVKEDWVELKMSDVEQVKQYDSYSFLNTGSPHYVCFLEDLAKVDVVQDGRKIRYSNDFQPGGTNVNFVQKNQNGIEVATYERGVEDETLSCGTGVTAAAIAYHLQHPELTEIPIDTKGGQLKVRLQREGKTFSNIWLCGPAQQVFKGEITI